MGKKVALSFTRFLIIIVLLFSSNSVLAKSIIVGDDNKVINSDCPPVQNTPSFTIVYGSAILNGTDAPVGSLVKTYSPRGDLVGCYKTTSVGNFGLMFVYGEDNTVNPPIPGMRNGEVVTFEIDGIQAFSAPVLSWQNDKDIHLIDITSQGVTANFSGTPLSGVYPLPVSFSDNSAGEISSWLWNFGDGQTSTLQNPSHTYTNPGSYTVSLTVTGDSGTDIETKTSYVNVYTPVSANFSSDKTTGVAPLSVTFTNLSTGDFSNSSWSFGDSGNSTQLNPSHTYTSGGTYTVSLTVQGPGGSDVEIKNGFITVYSPVDAKFSVDKNSGTYPLTIAFTNLSTGDYSTLHWDFGDGSSSDLANPTHQYSTKGTYQVILTASGLGGSDQYSMDIDVFEQVEADFSGTPLQGLSPLTVSFTNLSTGDYSTLLWSFGDGSTSTVANPSYLYTASGKYSVSLTASGPGGEDTKTVNEFVTVIAPSQAQFSASVIEGIAPLSVKFTNMSTGDFLTQTWDFGDGNTSTEFEPTHIYNSGGIYSVTLTIDGPGGLATETKINYITVYDPAQADFSATPLTGIAPLEVAFTNLSSGDYDSFAWDFGDGGSSDLENPSHIYTEPGVYSVSLTVSGAGGSDTETKTSYITVYDPAQADFSATPLTGIAPLEVAFTNLSSGDYDSFAWDFGDGGSSDLENPTHTYSTPGTYSVSLTISGSGGSDSETKTGYITVYDPAQADFSATPLSGIAPLEVAFTNLSSGDHDSFAWDFGDGGSSDLENPTHTYSTPGTYSVSLTISGSGGSDTETKTSYITVYDPAQADFSATPLTGIAPLEVVFTNLSSGDYDSFAWDFGDGGSSDLENPSHIYTEPGVYSVSLTISGSGGSDSETKTSYITVYDPAQADFSATPLTGIAPLEVAFTNLSSGDYDSFAWDFGDGASSDLENPTHTYSTPGTYSVSLTIEGLGGTATEAKVGYITVYEVVVANFSASPLIGQPILVVEFTNLSTGSYEIIEWDFGDGTFSDEINPIHSFSAIGTYQVTLSVEGPGGSDTFQREIIVIPYVNYLPLIVR